MVGLIVLFSFSVAASLLWLGGVIFYIYAKIGFPQLFGLPLNEIVMVAATTFLPIIFAWMVVGLLYNVMTLKKQGNTINLLLTQTRRSADHAEAMVRTLMEAQVQTRSALVLHNADLFINELNDLLSDIVVRFGLVQPAHTEIVWQRVGDGNRWAFCKVVLQNAENSPKFNNDLKAQMRRDDILSNAVRTFCYRFEQMYTMLERHDIEHYLTKIFEEGSLGRVYLRFVEACRGLEQQENAYYERQSFPAPPPEAVTEEEFFATAEEEAPLIPEEAELSFEIPQFEYGEEEPPLPEEEDYEPMPEQASPSSSDAGSPFGFLRPTR